MNNVDVTKPVIILDIPNQNKKIVINEDVYFQYYETKTPSELIVYSCSYEEYESNKSVYDKQNGIIKELEEEKKRLNERIEEIGAILSNNN